MNDSLCRVLLVEDNPGDVELTVQAAQTAGLNVEFSLARDGQEALGFLRREGEFAAARRPDLILLDLNMPKGSGHDVLESIKGDPGLRRIPILILTSSAADDDIRRAYDHHANGYVIKPIDFGDLVEMAQRIYDFWHATARLPD